MQLRELLGVLRSRWRTVAACLLVVVGITAAVTMTTTPTFTASSRVYLTIDRPPDTLRGDPGGVAVMRYNDLKTLAEVLYSPTVMEPLRAELGLPAGHRTSVWPCSFSENASVMDVIGTSSDPRLAAAIANTTGPVLAKVAVQFSPLLSQSAPNATCVTITSASVPGLPTTPDVRRNLALGILIGLALGVGLAMVRHALDTKVRGEADLKAASDRPVLAQIPLEPTAADRPITVESDPHGAHAESIRRLRTNLMFVDVTTGKHSFVLTSAMPGEGKTTTSINLALAIADAGSRVILVDGDLRNPSVAKAMGIEGGVGLTTALLGRASLADVIQPWGDTGMSVLAAGEIPPNPSELLGSRPMAELFEKLTADFDFVLIDSPPLVPVIDAVLLQRLTGGLVMVVAAERTRKKDLQTALTSLHTVDVDPAGFVLNFVPVSASDPYRYGTYRYQQGSAAASADPRQPRKERARSASSTATSGRRSRRRGRS
ncbi:MAG: polysaccharide biosynthesis tyrosine autokinase [Dermatophilaceae bacterium]